MSGKDLKTGSISIGGTGKGVTSTASGGGSREDDKRAQNGHTWRGWQHHQQRMSEMRAEWARRRTEAIRQMGGIGGMGFGGGFGGMGFGGMSFLGTMMSQFSQEEAAEQAAIEAEVANIDAKNQISQTTLEDIDPAVLEHIAPDTLLRFAFSPEDMAELDLKGEHSEIAKVRNVLTVNNPTPELMKHLIGSGQFEDVVWSGHGSKDGMWITNEEGKSELLPAKDMAKMFEDSTVTEMLLNVCNGGTKVDDALNEVGIDTFAYEREIKDAEAIEDAKAFAATGSLDGVSRIGAFENVDGKTEYRAGGHHQKASDAAASQVANAALAGLPMGGFLGPLALRGQFGATVDKPPVPTTSPTGTLGLAGVAKTLANTGTAHAAVTPEEEARSPLARARAGAAYNRFDLLR